MRTGSAKSRMIWRVLGLLGSEMNLKFLVHPRANFSKKGVVWMFSATGQDDQMLSQKALVERGVAS